MSKFLTPPVWYDKSGNLVEILTGISKDGGVGIGEGANAESGAVVIGNSALSTSDSNGGNRVWIGYTATGNAVTNMKSVVIGTIRTWSDDYSGKDGATVSNSVLIGGTISHQFPDYLSVNGSTIINSVMPDNGSGDFTDVIAIGFQSGDLVRQNDCIQIGSSDKEYIFKVGNRNVFNSINTAAGTFFIGTTKYKATYDSASYTLNFVPANT